MYITRFVKLPKSNKNTMYVIMTQIFTHTMPVNNKDKGFAKIYRTVCMAPNSLDLNPVDYVDERLCILISSLDDLKDRVCTCWANLDQQIIDKSTDH